MGERKRGCDEIEIDIVVVVAVVVRVWNPFFFLLVMRKI